LDWDQDFPKSPGILRTKSNRGGGDNMPYQYRYEVAEEILRNGGNNEEIQRRVLEEFPDSKENYSRAQWYRRSWEKFGHCRGPNAQNNKGIILKD
jgi:hypothetical protein